MLPIMPTIRALKAVEAQSPTADDVADPVATAVKGYRQRFATLGLAGVDTSRFSTLGLPQGYAKRFSDLAFAGLDTKRFSTLGLAGIDTIRFSTLAFAGLNTKRFASLGLTGMDTKRFASLAFAGLGTKRFSSLGLAEAYALRFSTLSLGLAGISTKGFSTLGLAEGYAKRFSTLAFAGIYPKRFSDLIASVQTSGGVLHQEASATGRSVDWLLFGQITLRSLFATFMLILMVAVWEEQKDTEPASALLELIGAIWLWNEIDRAIWQELS
jgi:hypothetical protein